MKKFEIVLASENNPYSTLYNDVSFAVDPEDWAFIIIDIDGRESRIHVTDLLAVAAAIKEGTWTPRTF